MIPSFLRREGGSLRRMIPLFPKEEGSLRRMIPLYPKIIP